MFARVSFWPTLAWNVALERAGRRTWYTRADARLLLGALPWTRLVPALVSEERVVGVVSLNEDFELKCGGFPLLETGVAGAEEWRAAGVAHLQLPTRDILHAPSQESLRRGVAFISEVLDQDKSQTGCVYVHCKAGRTRSATLAAAFLMARDGLSAEQAVSLLKSRRSHILIGPKQWAALRQFGRATHPLNSRVSETASASASVSDTAAR